MFWNADKLRLNTIWCVLFCVILCLLINTNILFSCRLFVDFYRVIEVYIENKQEQY